MKLFRLGVIAALILGLFAVTIPAAAKVSSPEYAADLIIVKYRDGVDENSPGAPHRKLGDSIESEIPELGIKVIKVPPGQGQGISLSREQRRGICRA